MPSVARGRRRRAPGPRGPARGRAGTAGVWPSRIRSPGRGTSLPTRLLVFVRLRGRRGRSALVRRRIRLGDDGRGRRRRLAGRRIRLLGLVRGDHHRVLYREAGAANPVPRVRHAPLEVVTERGLALVELDEPGPDRGLRLLVAAVGGGAEVEQRAAPLGLEQG